MSLLSAHGAIVVLTDTATSDDFSVNTLGLYTQTQDAAPAGWSIAGGQLIGTPTAGAQASLTRTVTSILDGYVEAVIDTAQDSGLLLRFTNQSNFYLLAISDGSGSNPTTNLRIFKRVAGTFTQLAASTALSWSRGTPKTVRFQVAGTALVGKLDGSTVVSASDSALAAAGRIGVRSNAPPGGGTNKYDSLAWG